MSRRGFMIHVFASLVSGTELRADISDSVRKRNECGEVYVHSHASERNRQDYTLTAKQTVFLSF